MINDVAPKPVDEQNPALTDFAEPRLDLLFCYRIPPENRIKLFVVQRKHLPHNRRDLVHKSFTFRTRCLCRG